MTEQYFITSNYAAEDESEPHSWWWRGYSFSLAFDIEVDTLIAGMREGNKVYVALYEAVGENGEIPDKLLASAEITETGRRSYKTIPTQTLTADKNYIMAVGGESSSSLFYCVEYWNTYEMLESEDFLTAWYPPEDEEHTLQALVWDNGGGPEYIIGKEPDPTASGAVDARPEIGLNHPYVSRVGDIQYIETPNTKIEYPKANRVTVKSETAEWTSTEPGVSEDNIVERIVEIDEGGQKICRQVADKLLERWSRKNVSITGDIRLFVDLQFEEEAKIVIPDSMIDGYYPVQSIEHDVIDQVSTVKAGDIILDDNELLARILDEL